MCRANYLASPPLVVAYALAGRMDFDIVNESLGNDKAGKPVYLRDIWPTPQKWKRRCAESVTSDQFHKQYADVFTGDEHWRALPIPEGDLYAWDDKSTYIKNPPYFEDHAAQAVGADSGFARAARAGGAGRQHHHRSYFSSRHDSARILRPENI